MRPQSKSAAPAHGELVDERVAAQRLRIARKTIQGWRLMSPPRGPAFIKYSGGTIRYDTNELERWLSERTIGAGSVEAA